MALAHPKRLRSFVVSSRVCVLGLVAPGLVACSNSRSNPLDCRALCPGADQPFELLSGSDEAGVRDFSAPLVMEYGPQGGQHVFIGVRIQVPAEERLQFTFRYLEAESGDEIAQARWQEDPEGCGLLIENIPLVFREDEAASGHVEMRAATLGCSWELASVEFRVRPPNMGVSDAGSSAEDSRDETSDTDASAKGASLADPLDASVEAGR